VPRGWRGPDKRESGAQQGRTLRLQATPSSLRSATASGRT